MNIDRSRKRVAPCEAPGWTLQDLSRNVDSCVRLPDADRSDTASAVIGRGMGNCIVGVRPGVQGAREAVCINAARSTRRSARAARNRLWHLTVAVAVIVTTLASGYWLVR